MTQYFSVAVERESNGTLSAYVLGLPGVYAAADTRAEVKRAIRGALAAHLATLKALGRKPEPQVEVAVLRRDIYATKADLLQFVGVGALLARATSRAKARASRRNGQKEGRPRVVMT